MFLETYLSQNRLQSTTNYVLLLLAIFSVKKTLKMTKLKLACFLIVLTGLLDILVPDICMQAKLTEKVVPLSYNLIVLLS